MSDDAHRPAAHPVIVFDGVCVLCSAWVGFLLRHDRTRRYRLASMQSETGRNLLRQQGLDPDDPASLLLLESGRAFTDSEAIVRVLEGLGGAWRVARVLRTLPVGWRDRAYRIIARNRYRWFGRHDVCLIPPPDQRGRFLD